MSAFGVGIGRFLGFVTQVMLARFYGPAQLGFYALGIALVEMSNILAQFGMDNGVVRYVAHHAAEGDARRVRGTIIQALVMTFALSLVLSGLIFFGAGLLADRVFEKPFLETTFRAFSASLPFLTLMSMSLWATQGFQTVKYSALVQQVVRPLLNLGFIVVFYLLGVEVLGAVAAYTLSLAACSVLGLYYLRRVFPLLFDRATKPRFESRKLLGASAPMTIASVTSEVNSWAGLTVLGIFASANTVGIYNVAYRTAALSALALVLFGRIFSPIISRLYRRNQMDDLGRLYHDVSKWTFTVALAIFLVTVILAADILAVFGPKFAAGGIALVVLAAAQLFNSSVGPTGRILAMTRYQRVVMVSTLASAAVGVSLSILLVPTYGILGAALGVAAAIVVLNAINLLSVRRLLGFWPYSRHYLKPLAIGLLAAAGAYGVKLALPLPAGIATILVTAPVFLAGFAALFLASGLGDSDRQLLTALWTAVRRTTNKHGT